MSRIEIKSYKWRNRIRIFLGFIVVILCTYHINSIESCYYKLYDIELQKSNLVEHKSDELDFRFDYNYQKPEYNPSDELKIHRDITYHLIQIIGYIGFGILLYIGNTNDRTKEY